MSFAHEKLIVYQQSIIFVAWARRFQNSLPGGSSAVRSLLDRASISIPLNIAEGNAKRSKTDQARFLQIAQGSAVECSACLDVAVAQELSDKPSTAPGKQTLEQIVKMLHGLIESRLNGSVNEDQAPYGNQILETDPDEEEDQD